MPAAITIEEILHARLIASAPVTAIVGQRIYPMTLPQGFTPPAITYFLATGVLGLTMGIALPTDEPHLQFSCWAKSYGQAKQLAAAVRAALNGYVDLTTNPQVNAVVARSNGPDFFEPDTALYHMPLDVSVLTQVTS